jgi:diguanylate cyclase (GGDEF)-like protein
MGETQHIEEIIKGTEKLPTLPGIAMKILETIRKDDVSLKEIGDLLSTDPSLSAEVLKIVNSSFYGFPTKITSVHHAINLLGSNAVKNLALSFSLVKVFKNAPATAFDYPQFWKDSLIQALAAKLMAAKIVPYAAEDAFFLGLLSDIGILTLNQCLPEQYAVIQRDQVTSGCRDYEAEDQVLGFNHMEVGAYLVETWGLPQHFSIPIRYHHEPDRLETGDDLKRHLSRILYLAALFAELIRGEDKSSTLGMLEMQCERYGYQQDVQVDAIAASIESQAEVVFPLFDIKLDKESSYVTMIETARKELINVSMDFMGRLVKQQQQMEVLRKQASHDGLTGLANFQHFHNTLEQEVYRVQRYRIPLTLIIGDIDHFKRVNDRHGHQAGDAVLKAIAKCLADKLRESDTVARYGGEEFAVILPETPLEGAMVVAERLCQAIAGMTVEYEGHTMAVTISFGVAALVPGEKASSQSLIKRADQALYRAKSKGRNQCRADALN